MIFLFMCSGLGYREVNLISVVQCFRLYSIVFEDMMFVVIVMVFRFVTLSIQYFFDDLYYNQSM